MPKIRETVFFGQSVSCAGRALKPRRRGLGRGTHRCKKEKQYIVDSRFHGDDDHENGMARSKTHAAFRIEP